MPSGLRVGWASVQLRTQHPWLELPSVLLGAIVLEARSESAHSEPA